MEATHSKKTTQSNNVPVVHLVDKGLDFAGNLDWYVKALSGKLAFRVYSISEEVAGTNVIGDLRGMVRSSWCRMLFRYTDDFGDALVVPALLASFASHIAEASPEFEKVASSKDPVLFKGLAYQRLVEIAMAKTAVGMITGGAQFMYLSLQGWCQIAGLVTPMRPIATQCIEVLKSADVLVGAAGAWVAKTAVENEPLSVIEITLRSRLGRSTPAVPKPE